MGARGWELGETLYMYLLTSVTWKGISTYIFYWCISPSLIMFFNFNSNMTKFWWSLTFCNIWNPKRDGFLWGRPYKAIIDLNYLKIISNISMICYYISSALESSIWGATFLYLNKSYYSYILGLLGVSGLLGRPYIGTYWPKLLENGSLYIINGVYIFVSLRSSCWDLIWVHSDKV